MTIDETATANEHQLIESIALTDDPGFEFAARAELSNRCLYKFDVDAEIDLYWERKAAERREYHRASAQEGIL